jgi:hypothetical protein
VPVYEGEGLLFLRTDEAHWYCPVRGRLVEDVEPATERYHCQLVIPEPLRGTMLHRQVEWLESVEVTVGGQDRHINIFSIRPTYMNMRAVKMLLWSRETRRVAPSGSGWPGAASAG